MNERYICYCGLYCESCATKAKVEPAARALYDEMKAAGFEDVIEYIPGGGGFWPFLRDMAENGTCLSCREGSGNPGCAIRICAKEKGVDICAVCESYPCGRFDELLVSYPMLREDNALYRASGINAWARLQEERRERGYTYTDAKTDR